MEILTTNDKQLSIHDVVKEDALAYEHPVKHYVSTFDGNEVFLTGYRNGRLVYATKTTVKTYKREASKIEKYVSDAIKENHLYESNLSEYCFADKRVILYRSVEFSLLIRHDLDMTLNRIRFLEENLQWRNIEELINQYEICLDDNDKRYIPYYREKLEMLNHFDFMWLSNNKYILNLFNRYLDCLKRDPEVDV